ncbi:hypothetical protein [Streptomyces prunicolor]|uniref:hypothetical protein n=1 Tax=Streptomyces prunicolor TaxID=67348 RepID=UPI0003796621|nr:hypothetical protein [Streptomyces prunicolor]
MSSSPPQLLPGLKDGSVVGAKGIPDEPGHGRHRLDHHLARARDIARVLALALALDTADARDLIVEIRTAEVGRAIGLALRREPLVLDKNSLHTLLDDFTSTDLTGIDLSGVRWSEHTTQWPSAIDIEDLKARSDETPPGTGTWIVRSGTATIRDHAER